MGIILLFMILLTIRIILHLDYAVDLTMVMAEKNFRLISFWNLYVEIVSHVINKCKLINTVRIASFGPFRNGVGQIGTLFGQRSLGTKVLS